MTVKDISAPGHGPSQLAEMTRHQNVMAEIDRQEILELHHNPPSDPRPRILNRPKKCPSCKEPHLSGGLLCPKCREAIIAQAESAHFNSTQNKKP